MRRSVFSFSLALALAACSGDAEPTGQVAATVDGSEITMVEVQSELNGLSSSDPKEQQALLNSALQNIITRTLLAKAAEEQGLTNTPEAAIMKKRADQSANMELLNRKLRGEVPAVSEEQVDAFVSENPNMFGQRKIWLVEQFVVANPPSDLIEQLKPIGTMAEVQALLQLRKLPANQAFGVIDALTLAPTAVRQIEALSANEVFILPDANGVRINRIRETQVVPIGAADARRVAKDMLQSQRSNELVENQIQQILAGGQSKIKYSAGFKPAAPAKTSPAAASSPPK
jgi:EpsD family peptidyl-prolyl cis-trans isomerase